MAGRGATILAGRVPFGGGVAITEALLADDLRTNSAPVGLWAPIETPPAQANDDDAIPAVQATQVLADDSGFAVAAFSLERAPITRADVLVKACNLDTSIWNNVVIIYSIIYLMRISDFVASQP